MEEGRQVRRGGSEEKTPEVIQMGKGGGGKGGWRGHGIDR